MRFTRLVAAAAVLAAAAAAVAPVHAQSILQRLFGPGGSRTPEYRDGRMNGRMGAGGGGNMSRFDTYGDYGGWQEDYTAYNTMCVRLCDGFYFPISYGVRRGRLYQDNRACMSRCDGEARLFHYPTQGGSVQTMVDMAGRPYASLPNAFRYRKALVSGCTCKAAPWSGEMAARHRGYAADEAYAGAEADVEAQTRAANEMGEGAGPYRVPPSYEPESYGPESYGPESYGSEPNGPEPDYPGYAERPVYDEPPRSYEPWPRNQRMPRTPWARGWRN